MITRNEEDIILTDERKEEIETLFFNFINFFNEFLKPFEKDVKRMINVDEDEEGNPKLYIQWLDDRNSGLVAITDAVINPKGVVEIHYNKDDDKYQFRIDDRKIAGLIGDKFIEPCLNYKYDKENELHYFDYNDENVINVIEEYFKLLYEKKVDHIQTLLESTNDELKRIQVDLIHFCQILQSQKDYLQFRLLYYPYIKPDKSGYEILVKMILWPDNPCPISESDERKLLDNKNPNQFDAKNSERAGLIRSIHDFFYNNFVENTLDKESPLYKYLSNLGNGEMFLHIHFRREEDKMVDRMAAFVAEERPVTIYDTNRAFFGEDTEKQIWLRSIKNEVYKLGKIMEDVYKNILSFKLSFKEILNPEDNTNSFSLIVTYEPAYEFDADVENTVFIKIIELLTTRKDIPLLTASYQGFQPEGDKETVYDIKMVRREKKGGSYQEDMLDLYTFYEYRI